MNKEITILDWDSKHFGKKIASLQTADITAQSLEKAIGEAEDSSVDCLYCLLPSDEMQKVHLLEENKFKLMDIRVTFTKDLKSSPKTSVEKLPVATMEDQFALIKLSESSFRGSRFLSDPQFDQKKANQMYVEWIKKNLKSDFPVFLSKANGKIEGFMSTDRKDSVGKLSLMAVEAAGRGKGIGRKLVETAYEYLRETGCETCEVVTQAQNLTAIRIYERCGFMLSRVDLWFHKWFTKEMRAVA